MILYRGGYKYQLAQRYSHRLPEVFIGCQAKAKYFQVAAGSLIVMTGYAWDGPSGPTIDTKNFMRGSLVHDCLYQAMRMNMIPADLREAADRELQRICIEDGMSKLRAWWVYQGVSKFGAKNVSEHNRRPVLICP